METKILNTLNESNNFIFNCNAQYLIAMLEGKQPLSLNESYYAIDSVKQNCNVSNAGRQLNVFEEKYTDNNTALSKQHIVANCLINLANLYLLKTNNKDSIKAEKWIITALNYMPI